MFCSLIRTPLPTFLPILAKSAIFILLRTISFSYFLASSVKFKMVNFRKRRVSLQYLQYRKKQKFSIYLKILMKKCLPDVSTRDIFMCSFTVV